MSEATIKNELQGLMVFVGSLANGVEHVLGRGASSISFRAGYSVGAKGEPKKKTKDLEEALALVSQELEERGINWEFTPFKSSSASDLVYEKDGRKALQLSFHNCMVRCALFRFAHEQKQSLCQMEMGLLCGLLHKITGDRAELKVLHAGENACLKELLVERKD